MTSAQLVRLPGTNMDVSRICLGGNRFGAQLDQDASFEILDAFYELGGNFVDTAHVYADWVPNIERSSSEKTIGRWIVAHGLKEDLIVATKGGHPELGRSGSRLDARSLSDDARSSRENLGLETLPIFYLHRDDPTLPAEEILGALEELRIEGVICHYAASNWKPARLVEATQVAKRNGWQGFVANQSEWSLAHRNSGSAAPDLVSMDGALFDWHVETRTASIPYSAQARGYFNKLVAEQLDRATAEAYDNAQSRFLAGWLSEIGARLGATPTQVMLALLLKAPFVVVPVVGCQTREQINACFESVRLNIESVPPKERKAYAWI